MARSRAPILGPTELKNRLEDLDEQYAHDPEAKNSRMLDEFFDVLLALGYDSAIEVYKNAKKY